MSHKEILESSFRDPSGFLFVEEGRLFRQVNACYQQDYDRLMNSGLYKLLTEKKLLIPHAEISTGQGMSPPAYKVIEPERISFISYPYEWSYSQLKDAAVTTLEIQKIALQYGMTLKDASAYNIQFHHGSPVLIDTLSFEIYQEGRPWDAYKQFCQHFLAPLALMSYTDVRLNQMLKLYIDGLPLDLTSRLLPFKTKFNFSMLMHLHLHARSQSKYEKSGSAGREIKISLSNLQALIGSLISMVRNLRLKKQRTEWEQYYTFTNYSDRSFAHKKEIIDRFIREIKPQTLWDLGANTGEFTRIASEQGVNCIAFDIDPLAVDSGYRNIQQHKISNILPLVMDLTNPSPAIGWNNEERMGFKSRPLPDLVFALALIHHLAISNNLPFDKIARFFCELSENLVIEFVPKSDSKVQVLLASRKDIFFDYHQDAFEQHFLEYFTICAKEKVNESERVVYWMKRK